MITLAVDAMGGDHGLKVVIPAAVKAVKKHRNLCLILVGREVEIQAMLKKHGEESHPRLKIHHAPEVVEMDELPSQALRSKRQSSMRKAINLVKTKEADACVSAGNTGALMATARFVLKTLPGIDRPAISAELPSITGKPTRVLDLGANVDSCAEHLYQFAVMGVVLCRAIDNQQMPRVGLLNIGVEEIKGNDQVKRTAQLLQENEQMNYIGFVEGDALYNGKVDLVVCDGFVGNVALKTSEGVAKLVFHKTKHAFKRNLLTKFIGFFAYPILKIVKKQLDPSRYNGASLLGLNGIVVKSHGGANALAFGHAIEEAMLEVEKNVPAQIHDEVGELLTEFDE
jgi:glycerol-3-phosphate acyltransferase PlsX